MDEEFLEAVAVGETGEGVDPAAVAGLSTRERSVIAQSLALGDFADAAESANRLIEALTAAWRQAESIGYSRDDMLPLLAEFASAQIDLAQCQVGLGEGDGAVVQLGAAIEVLGLMRQRLEMVGYDSCLHGNPSKTGRCARRPPCPQPPN